MICHELERAAKAYLQAVTGTLVDDVGEDIGNGNSGTLVTMPQGLPGYTADGLGVEVDGDGVPTTGDPEFRFYCGENNTDIKTPCAIIAAAAGDEDFDTGNETVQLEVAVHVQATAFTEGPAPIGNALEISEAIINALRRDDVDQYLNLYRTDPERLTVIGCSARQTSKSVDGSKIIHQVSLTLYCAACDLSPVLAASED